LLDEGESGGGAIRETSADWLATAGSVVRACAWEDDVKGETSASYRRGQGRWRAVAHDDRIGIVLDRTEVQSDSDGLRDGVEPGAGFSRSC